MVLVIVLPLKIIFFKTIEIIQFKKKYTCCNLRNKQKWEMKKVVIFFPYFVENSYFIFLHSEIAFDKSGNEGVFA